MEEVRLDGGHFRFSGPRHALATGLRRLQGPWPQPALAEAQLGVQSRPRGSVIRRMSVHQWVDLPPIPMEIATGDSNCQKFFISYRREDTGASAGRLSADLKKDFGKRNVFFDLDRAEKNPGGTIWLANNIDRAISDTDIAFVLIGDKWCGEILRTRASSGETDVVHYEVSALLRRGAPVVAIRVDNAGLPTADQLGLEMVGLTRSGSLAAYAVELEQRLCLRIYDLSVPTNHRILVKNF